MRDREPSWCNRVEADLYKISIFRFILFGWFGWIIAYILWVLLYPIIFVAMWINGNLGLMSDRRAVFIRKAMGGVWKG